MPLTEFANRISKLTKRYQPQRLDTVLSKYSKHSISVGGIEYYYDEAIKHSQSEPEETIAERVTLNPQKEKEDRNRNQNLNSKQTIEQTSSIVSTNKIWNNS